MLSGLKSWVFVCCFAQQKIRWDREDGEESTPRGDLCRAGVGAPRRPEETLEQQDRWSTVQKRLMDCGLWQRLWGGEENGRRNVRRGVNHQILKTRRTSQYICIAWENLGEYQKQQLNRCDSWQFRGKQSAYFFGYKPFVLKGVNLHLKSFAKRDYSECLVRIVEQHCIIIELSLKIICSNKTLDYGAQMCCLLGFCRFSRKRTNDSTLTRANKQGAQKIFRRKLFDVAQDLGTVRDAAPTRLLFGFGFWPRERIHKSERVAQLFSYNFWLPICSGRVSCFFFDLELVSFLGQWL